MNPTLNYISDYFENYQTTEQINRFQNRVLNVPGFIEEVDWYLTYTALMKKVSKEDAKKN